MRIDVHAHYYTEALIDTIEKLGGAFVSGPKNAPNVRVGIDERVELLAAASIDLQIVSPGAMQPYFTDASRAVTGAKQINDTYAQVVREHKHHLKAFGCVPLPHVDEANREAGRCLDELGFAGINLGCTVNGRPLDDSAFEEFWGEMDRRHAIVCLHPLGTVSEALDAYGLAWTVGGCFEDTVAAIRLVSSGLIERFQAVRVIVPHLGGTIPFLWGRISRPEVRAGLKRLYYDSLNTAPGMLCAACHVLSADRVMLGTDFPWGPAHFGEHISTVQQAGLTPGEVHGILDQNATALFNG